MKNWFCRNFSHNLRIKSIKSRFFLGWCRNTNEALNIQLFCCFDPTQTPSFYSRCLPHRQPFIRLVWIIWMWSKAFEHSFLFTLLEGGIQLKWKSDDKWLLCRCFYNIPNCFDEKQLNLWTCYLGQHNILYANRIRVTEATTRIIEFYLRLFC